MYFRLIYNKIKRNDWSARNPTDGFGTADEERRGEQLELQILDWLYEMHSPVMDQIMVFITRLGDAGFFWILLAVILLIPRQTRGWGLTMGFALLLGLITVNFGIKPLVHRVRPYDAAGLTDLLVKRQSDYSFPSGHTQAAFASAWILYRMNRKGGILAMILAVLIAFSRLYLYMHYPTDVLAGFLFGSLWAFLALRYFKPWISRKMERMPRPSQDKIRR